MASPARKIRRAHERQMVKAMIRAQRQTAAAAPPPPSPAEAPVDERLAQHGVSLERSLLWTPAGSRR